MRLGYYQVGDKIHLNKVAALIDGTERNIHPEWVFNNDVFDKFSWSEEPEESLSELYSQRAKEIRQTYDYVILAFSGGSDSHNILNAFIKNNLKIDEIVVSWAVKLSEVRGTDPWDYKDVNQLSEWELTVKPKLQWMRQNHPETKITVYDWTDGYSNYKIDDDFSLHRGTNLAYFADKRWSIDNISSIEKRISTMQNSIIIWGICKPRVCLQDNTYKLYFLDQVGFATTSELNNERTEYFYWHPSSARMIAKQCHLIVRFFEENPMFKQFIRWPQTPRAREFYENCIRAIIYPEVDLNFFQGSKWSNFNFAWDLALMDLDPAMNDKLNYHFFETMQGLHSVIENKYFQTVAEGEKLTGFIAGMYPIAKESITS
jgi:hypothetical protein